MRLFAAQAIAVPVFLSLKKGRRDVANHAFLCSQGLAGRDHILPCSAPVFGPVSPDLFLASCPILLAFEPPQLRGPGDQTAVLAHQRRRRPAHSLMLAL